MSNKNIKIDLYDLLVINSLFLSNFFVYFVYKIDRNMIGKMINIKLWSQT